MPLSLSQLLPVLCVLATVINLWALGHVKVQTKQLVPIRAMKATHSQTGDDHPDYLIHPNQLRKVALDAEESVFYELGTEEAYKQWRSYLDREEHAWFKLGPRMHAYVHTMSHDLHCLLAFHDAMFAESPKWGHVQHCLSYMRQVILCDADLTLEEPDALDRDHTVHRQGDTHICRDWTAVMEMTERLEDSWLNFFDAQPAV